MRSKGLSFADAVRLLDGDARPVGWLGQLAGVAAGTVDFFALRNQVVEWGHSAVRGWRDRVQGLGRFDRTERLVAAHSVIVIVAFFEALDELGISLELDAAEQVALAGGSPVADGYAEMSSGSGPGR